MGELNKGARRPKNVPPVRDQENRRARRRLHGRRHRLCVGAGRDRRRADRPRSGRRRQGQGSCDTLLSTAVAKGRSTPEAKAQVLVAHHSDRRLCGARGRRSGGRGGVRGSRGQGRGDRKSAGRGGAGCDLRLQHLHPADHLARRELAQAGKFRRRAFLLAGGQDAAGRDHPRRQDGRPRPGHGAGFRPRHQEDADRRP